MTEDEAIKALESQAEERDALARVIREQRDEALALRTQRDHFERLTRHHQSESDSWAALAQKNESDRIKAETERDEVKRDVVVLRAQVAGLQADLSIVVAQRDAFSARLESQDDEETDPDYADDDRYALARDVEAHDTMLRNVDARVCQLEAKLGPQWVVREVQALRLFPGALIVMNVPPGALEEARKVASELNQKAGLRVAVLPPDWNVSVHDRAPIVPAEASH